MVVASTPSWWQILIQWGSYADHVHSAYAGFGAIALFLATLWAYVRSWQESHPYEMGIIIRVLQILSVLLFIAFCKWYIDHIPQSPGQVTECDILTADKDDPQATAHPIDNPDDIPETAIDYCKRDAENNPKVPRYRYQLGLAYKANSKMADAVAAYERAAGEGYGAAMEDLGWLYYNGVPGSVNKDKSKAREWFQKADAAGNCSAMIGLGNLMEEAGDFRLADKQYQRAGEHGFRKPDDNGCSEGWYRKGLLHDEDSDNKNWTGLLDYHEALADYYKASEAGNLSAKYQLALLYLKGRTGDPNCKIAYDLLSEAANDGDATAVGKIGELYADGYLNDNGQLWDNCETRNPNYATAIEYYKRSADRGDQLGRYGYAALLDEGKGISQPDPQEAARQLEIAAKSANGHARYELLNGMSDWSPNTREQIRSALKADGYKVDDNGLAWTNAENDPVHQALVELFSKHNN